MVHCFTGTPAECEGWLALGAYIGITGIVTYKNAGDVREAAKTGAGGSAAGGDGWRRICRRSRCGR